MTSYTYFYVTFWVFCRHLFGYDQQIISQQILLLIFRLKYIIILFYLFHTLRVKRIHSYFFLQDYANLYKGGKYKSIINTTPLAGNNVVAKEESQQISRDSVTDGTPVTLEDSPTPNENTLTSPDESVSHTPT